MALREEESEICARCNLMGGILFTQSHAGNVIAQQLPLRACNHIAIIVFGQRIVAGRLPAMLPGSIDDALTYISSMLVAKLAGKK